MTGRPDLDSESYCGLPASLCITRGSEVGEQATGVEAEDGLVEAIEMASVLADATPLVPPFSNASSKTSRPYPTENIGF